MSTSTNWTYAPKSEEQLKSWYNGKVKDNVIEFTTFNEFKQWYDQKPKHCYYCDLSEEHCQFIVHTGILRSKRFPIGGEFKRGVNRGYWLEVDRKQPNGKYSATNCELCCYFCNNDKSDVFTDLEYREFHQNRGQFFNKLIANYENKTV